MVVNRLFYLLLLSISVITFANCASWTNPKQTSPSDIEFRIQGYEQQDNKGGNPYLNEKQSISEPVIILHDKLANDIDTTFRYARDSITGDSFKTTQTDARAGASKDVRNSAQLSLSKKFDIDSASLSAGYSKESDYLSRNVSLGYTKMLFDNNTSVTIRGTKFFDLVDNFDRWDIMHGQKNRDTMTLGMDISQYLSPRDSLVSGIAYTHQTGLLSTPRSFVVTSNGTFDEVLPDTRNRNVIFIKERHALDKQNSIELGTRYYSDSWGLKAHTPEIKYLHDFGNEEYLLCLNYRFNNQQGMKYFHDTLVTMPRFATQDSDLADLKTTSAGAILTFPLLPTFEAEIGVENFDRSDKITGILWSFGLKYKQTTHPLITNMPDKWWIIAIGVVAITAVGEVGDD